MAIALKEDGPAKEQIESAAKRVTNHSLNFSTCITNKRVEKVRPKKEVRRK